MVYRPKHVNIWYITLHMTSLMTMLVKSWVTARYDGHGQFMVLVIP